MPVGWLVVVSVVGETKWRNRRRQRSCVRWWWGRLVRGDIASMLCGAGGRDAVSAFLGALVVAEVEWRRRGGRGVLVSVGTGDVTLRGHSGDPGVARLQH